MRSVNQGKSWSDKRIRSFIHKQEKLFWKEGYCCWVVEDKIKRNFVGSCGVGVFDPPGCLDLGWWVAKKYIVDKVLQHKPHVMLWNTLSGKFGFLT